jgi:uncharacterized membrane protein (TIGR01666 family)
MDYTRAYRSFVNSYYLSQGIRSTVGIAVPAILLSQFHLLGPGLLISLGALAVSATDLPGPIQDRIRGMFLSTLCIFLMALATSWLATYPAALAILIFFSCFLFSMIGIFGSRSNSIGLSVLLVMVLVIDRPAPGTQALVSAAWIGAGGCWFAGLSLLLYRLKPYRLAQQALGECIQSTASYLSTRAAFFDRDPDYASNYRLLLELQGDLHAKQELIRELLFRSRQFVKESTLKSRILVMIFLDIVDLFERTMSSQQDLVALHRIFDESGILLSFKSAILDIAKELDAIGLAVKSGKQSPENPEPASRVQALENEFLSLRDKLRNAENLEEFIMLRRVLENVQDLAGRLQSLKGYTGYDQSLGKKFRSGIDYEQFITPRETGWPLFAGNLNFSSNMFRHALRVSVATILGYWVSRFFPVGHSYWILLTIVVILKPAYSLTKQRNYQRLIGTVLGAVIAILLILTFPNRSVLLGIMLLLMIGTYSFLRIQYLVSVLCMTPFILILFHLLTPHDFRSVAMDRLVDTGIGSGIAFLASMLLVPAWEQAQIRDYMIRVLEANSHYLGATREIFTLGMADPTAYKLSRKNAYVSLANLSDAFNRMLSEPRSKQKNIQHLHPFVVLNHMLTSHIATLSYFAQKAQPWEWKDLYLPIIENIRAGISRAEGILQGDSTERLEPVIGPELRKLLADANQLSARRREELRQGRWEGEAKKALAEIRPIADQFQFMARIAGDLERKCLEMTEAERNPSQPPRNGQT